VSLLLGSGGGGFGIASSFTVDNQPYSLAIADWNGDNKPDLAVGKTGHFDSDYTTLLINKSR